MTSTSAPPGKSGAIKRSFIVKQLWPSRDDDDYDDGLDQVSRWIRTTDSESSCSDSVGSSHGASDALEEDEADSSLLANAELSVISAWLEAKCEEELAGINWEPEFEHPLSKHDVTFAGLNIAKLQRIRRGHGPRSSKFEDLLAPLRLRDSGRAPRFSKRPIKETFESLERTLRDWNMHVASTVCDDTEIRAALMEAMRSRIIFLNKVLISRRSADAHDDTCRRLLNAIHVYRPETLDFVTQDPMYLLTIIIAHLGYAIPDIDNALKYRMLYTLVTERVYIAHASNANTRREYAENIEEAESRGDVAGAVKFKQKQAAWTGAELQKNCDIIMDRIKTARRNVQLKVLEELQELSVLQIAQKLVLSERLANGKSPSEYLVQRSVWWSERAKAREAAELKVKEFMTDYLDDLETSCRVAARAIDDMKDVNKARVLTRAVKFAGSDLKNISEDERHRVVQERMANPGTVVMMTDAINGVVEINVNAEGTAESAAKMEGRLEEMRAAVSAVNYEYDSLSKLVNSDPHMILGGSEGARDGVR